MREQNDHIVISGCGVISPWGEGYEAISEFLANDQKSKNSFTINNVSGFDASQKLGKSGLRAMNCATKFGLAATLDCLADAGLNTTAVDTKMGVVIGSHLGHMDRLEEMMKTILEEGSCGLSPMGSGNGAINVMASAIGMRIGARALNTTINNGYTSGLDAVQYGCRSLVNNHAEYVLAGGVESASRYYIEWLKANGCNLAFEGAGLILLEKSATALQRGITPLGTVKGYSTTPYLDLNSVERSIGMALKRAGLRVEEIDAFVGTSDLYGEQDEGITLLGLGFTGPRLFLRQVLGEGLAVIGIYQMMVGIDLLKKGCRNVLIHLFGKESNSSSLILSR
jgi:3-oxoacyl-[acyl-carrier-protein] synthase II